MPGPLGRGSSTDRIDFGLDHLPQVVPLAALRQPVNLLRRRKALPTRRRHLWRWFELTATLHCAHSSMLWPLIFWVTSWANTNLYDRAGSNLFRSSTFFLELFRRAAILAVRGVSQSKFIALGPPTSTKMYVYNLLRTYTCHRQSLFGSQLASPFARSTNSARSFMYYWPDILLDRQIQKTRSLSKS